MRFWPFVLLALAVSALAGGEPIAKRDLAYVSKGHARQKLDLYLPASGTKNPLLVWIHGGAWKEGDKEYNPALPLVQKGFAVAGINYRLSQHARFPAQLEDCKAAIRWLRAHARENRIDPDRVGVWGISAGGHLCALLGTTGELKDFDVGENLDVSSRVQCVVDWSGPTDFEELGKTYPSERDSPNSPIALLLGGPLAQHLALARRASPIQYSLSGAPPFLIMHGDRDDVVPKGQSELLFAALQKAGVVSTLKIIRDGGHIFLGRPEATQPLLEFLRTHLGP